MLKMLKKMVSFKKSYLSFLIGMTYFYSSALFAEGTSSGDIGSIATTVTKSFESIGKLMAATAYLTGFGLTIAAIFKFKQHKDNPTQIPMGTPIALLVVGVTLIFLPSLIGPAGQTIFGSGSVKAGGFSGAGVSGGIPGA